MPSRGVGGRLHEANSYADNILLKREVRESRPEAPGPLLDDLSGLIEYLAAVFEAYSWHGRQLRIMGLVVQLYPPWTS